MAMLSRIASIEDGRQSEACLHFHDSPQGAQHHMYLSNLRDWSWRCDGPLRGGVGIVFISIVTTPTSRLARCMVHVTQ